MQRCGKLYAMGTVKQFTRRLIGVAAIATTLSLARAATPPGPPPRPGPPGLDHAVEQLDLTDEQRPAVDAIVREYARKEQQAREDFLNQMRAAITPGQYDKLEAAMARSDPPPRPGHEPRSARTTAAARPAAVLKLADGSLRVRVIFTGGYETDPRDGGRPVVLIAAALGVPTDVFRKAFSGVTPAAAGEEPAPGQVRRNKAALLKVLEPYGITNDQLDTVSNQYRYAGSKGEMWPTTPAVATARVVDGMVKSFTITGAGSGYSSPPQVSVEGMPDVKADASLDFGSDFKTNGSVKAIALKAGK